MGPSLVHGDFRLGTDPSSFGALATFPSVATWPLMIKHNRRKRAARKDLE